MDTPTIRPPALKATDPLAVIISAGIVLASLFGVFSWLGFEAQEIVVLESTLLIIAAVIRARSEKRNETRVRGEFEVAMTKAYEAGAASGGAPQD